LQLVVIGFGRAAIPMDFVNQLRRVREEGIVRVVDAEFISKDEHGDINSIQATDLSQEEAALFGTLARALFGYGAAGEEGALLGIDSALARAETGEFGLSEDDIDEIADLIEPGTAALFLLFEHVWAKGLKEAVRNANGEVIAQGFITPATLIAMGQDAMDEELAEA
jgi:uncharacterized membrane protein